MERLNEVLVKVKREFFEWNVKLQKSVHNVVLLSHFWLLFIQQVSVSISMEGQKEPEKPNGKKTTFLQTHPISSICRAC